MRFFPRGEDNSKYTSLIGGGMGLYMKIMELPCYGSIVDPVDLVDLLDPLALYSCFTLQ